MPVYDYIATDAQGAQRRGKMPAIDKNDLTTTLQKDGMFLVSCHESKEQIEGLDSYIDHANQEPVAAAAGSAGEEPKERRWPIQSPAEYVVIMGIFFFCVLLGYLLGR